MNYLNQQVKEKAERKNANDYNEKLRDNLSINK